MAKDNTTRFSNRVDDYVKYRPGYPDEMVNYLRDAFGLQKGMCLADIGAGTGISSELLLRHGYEVIAVEPNGPMRQKLLEQLGQFPGFSSTAGTAEQTVIADHAADGIIACQAFHWFDRKRARAEFSRILKPGGVVALVWNERLVKSDFEREYEKLIIRHGKDYVKVDHRNINPQDIAEFFHPNSVKLEVFANKQVFDLAGLLGRLLSSSYMPGQDEPGFNAMKEDLTGLFERHHENGLVQINYETKVFAGSWLT